MVFSYSFEVIATLLNLSKGKVCNFGSFICSHSTHFATYCKMIDLANSLRMYIIQVITNIYQKNNNFQYND